MIFLFRMSKNMFIKNIFSYKIFDFNVPIIKENNYFIFLHAYIFYIKNSHINKKILVAYHDNGKEYFYQYNEKLLIINKIKIINYYCVQFINFFYLVKSEEISLLAFYKNDKFIITNIYFDFNLELIRLFPRGNIDVIDEKIEYSLPLLKEKINELNDYYESFELLNNL